jgi:hypothetical protein
LSSGSGTPESGHEGIYVESESRPFEVYFKDRTEITGKTYGSRTDKNSIHLHEQTKVGRKLRYCTHLFVSKVAIQNHTIGCQIGYILVQGKQISQDVLEIALKGRQVGRSRLIGDYLINQKIVDSDELENAPSRQKHMPNLKLGEILITKGVIAKSEIHQCLSKKLGIPFVNLREFIVEPDVIRLLTAAIAFKHKVVRYTFTKRKS